MAELEPNNRGAVASALKGWGAGFARASAGLAVTGALGLLLFGRIDPTGAEALRGRAGDAFAPILGTIAEPLAAVRHATEWVAGWRDLHAENEALKAENARLRGWYDAGLKLEAQNAEMRALLNFKPDPAHAQVTARVVAETGGVFARSLLVGAGTREGVKRGAAAMAGPALVGRITEAGTWSSRLLLLTDINSRVPVLIEATRQHAILAGDNGPHPRLLYLPGDAVLHQGDRVVTSGDDGLFPPDIPVGTIEATPEGQVRLKPEAELSRLEHVQLVDFGGLAIPLPEGDRPAAPPPTQRRGR